MATRKQDLCQPKVEVTVLLRCSPARIRSHLQDSALTVDICLVRLEAGLGTGAFVRRKQASVVEVKRG